jgi:hypothetical protein
MPPYTDASYPSILTNKKKPCWLSHFETYWQHTPAFNRKPFSMEHADDHLYLWVRRFHYASIEGLIQINVLLSSKMFHLRHPRKFIKCIFNELLTVLTGRLNSQVLLLSQKVFEADVSLKIKTRTRFTWHAYCS